MALWPPQFPWRLLQVGGEREEGTGQRGQEDVAGRTACRLLRVLILGSKHIRQGGKETVLPRPGLPREAALISVLTRPVLSQF